MGKVCVIIGDDDYLVSEAAKKIVGDGTGLELIDSNLSSNEDLRLKDIRLVEESYKTPPFFDPVKVTWWKNVKFLPGSRAASADEGEGEGASKAASEAVKAALQRFADLVAKGGMSENQSLLITGPSLLQTSVFAKTLAKVAEMVYFAKPKGTAAQREAADRAMARAGEMGLKFSARAIERFIAKVGQDTRSIYSELEKMLAFKNGPGAVSEDDIDAISSPGAGVEPVAWQVTDAISMRDAKKCIAAVHSFGEEQKTAILLVTVIEKQFRQMVEMKDAQMRGKLDQATKGMPGWSVRKLEASLSRWRLNELRAARMRFMTLRERIVSGGADAIDLMMIEIARTCGAPGRGGR
ncbi:MAG: hypothetical protein J6P13_03730 [Kiritimatiellae bacterium]|nr:hypothetical protein [Kiritimatiellia bacterium]